MGEIGDRELEEPYFLAKLVTLQLLQRQGSGPQEQPCQLHRSELWNMPEAGGPYERPGPGHQASSLCSFEQREASNEASGVLELRKPGEDWGRWALFSNFCLRAEGTTGFLVTPGKRAGLRE